MRSIAYKMIGYRSIKMRSIAYKMIGYRKHKDEMDSIQNDRVQKA